MRSVRIPGAGRDAERARAFARESGVNDARHGPTLVPILYISDVGGLGRKVSHVRPPPSREPRPDDEPSRAPGVRVSTPRLHALVYVLSTHYGVDR